MDYNPGNTGFNSEMRWKKIASFSQKYEISAAGQKMGYLKRNSFLSGGGKCEFSNQIYEFNSVGLINKTISVIQSGSGTQSGIIELQPVGTENGTFNMASGAKYIWKCTDLFRGKWGWLDEGENLLISYNPEALLSQKGKIILHSPFIKPEKDILLLLGLHLTLLFNLGALSLGAFILHKR